MKKRGFLLLLCLTALLLTACQQKKDAQPDRSPCQVVLEETEGITAESWVVVANSNGEAAFSLRVSDGFTLLGADWPDHTLAANPAGKGVTLTLRQVRYSTVVSLQVARSPVSLQYFANGGQRLDGGDPAQAVELAVTPSHPRLNTATGTELFAREGWTLTGWNTAPDGSGTPVGLGSRIAWQEGLALYAQWSRWTEAQFFTCEPSGDGVALTGYTGSEEVVTIPAYLAGKPVRAIGAGAFAGAACKTVILPPGLREVQPEAFLNAALETLYLFDDLAGISDYAFSGCEGLATLHINAVEAPVYSGTYFDTFSDKYDRLLSLRGKKKIVLFSGSSTRFGYNSAMLDAAFPEYEVVNMGVFAYTNALPQLLLILDCVDEGDVLLHSPEFDAAKRQFCTTTALDAPFFAMMESNYDNVARLDLRQLSGVFTALNAYLGEKAELSPRSYALSPADFDEDRDPVDTPSYNEYGDYILFRPNPATDQPVYGLPVDYMVAAFPEEDYIAPLNAVFRLFLEKGVAVFFTYAPRNQYALSPGSTPRARAVLDRYFRERLIVPVISALEDSLVPGTLLYGTDNHLSTQGAALRTEQIIIELREALSQYPQH